MDKELAESKTGFFETLLMGLGALVTIICGIIAFVLMLAFSIGVAFLFNLFLIYISA